MQWKFGWVATILVALLGADLVAAKPPRRRATTATKTAQDAQNPTTLQQALAPSLVREGTVEAELAGDFDGDGTPDLAVVILSPPRPGTEGGIVEDRTRTLVMGLRDGAGFRAVQSSSCLALCTQCGGVMGDPFQGLSTSGKDRLAVSNYGGSRYRWSVRYVVAWHKGAFRVVAVDSTSQDTARPNRERQRSVNLLAGTQKTGKDAKGERHKWQPIPIDQCEKLERIPRATF